MERDISPPPAKRRKTNQATVPEPPHPPPSEVPGPPDQDIMRIFSWNINGIAPFLQKSIISFFPASSKASTTKTAVPPASLRDFLRRHHWPALLLLQEVKIASKDTKTQDAVRSAVTATPSTSSKEPTYEAHFTLPCDPHNARGPRGSGRVYGVCSILRKDLRDTYDVNVRTVEWDIEGRVSVIEFTNPKKKTRLAIFNIYAVNGTDNPYRDPETGVQQGTRHDRKRAFHTLLAAECVALEKEGWHVLLAGDMNVAPTSLDGYPTLRTFPHQHVANRAHFHTHLLHGGEAAAPAFAGTDVWRVTHRAARRFTYYPRSRTWGTSCDRVDFFVAGRRAWSAGMIGNSGILDSEVERGPSDHVPVWVDVNFEL